jgi:hypothetical protein
VSLLSPWWLLSLIALPIMAALYLLKVRPRRQATNAFFLWEQIYQQNSSRAFFKRLRDLWSLLLMLLVLALLAFAMAEPVIDTEDPRDLIIVVDASASMQAQTGHGTRMELAQAEAERLIRGLNGQRQAAVASVSDRLHFHSHLSRYPRELLDAVATIEASDMPLRESAMQRLIEDLLAEDASYRILFLTDHQSSAMELPPGLDYSVLELEPVANAGIVAADVQWQPGRADAATFYLRVLNSADSELSADLELRNLKTGVVAKILPLTIAAGDSFETVFELEGVIPGIWQMSLLHNDAFSLDDTVTLGLNPRRPITVSIESAHHWFYENCVRAFEQAGGVLELKNADASLQLVEGEGISDAPTSLIFNPKGSSPFWESLGEPIAVDLPEVLTPTHPFLEHLDVPALRFAGARELVPAPGALVLVAAEDGTPLIYKITRDQRSALVVNLDPNASNFFLSPWFPVIVHAAALHLSGRESAVAPVYASGRSVQVPGESGTSWTMTAPRDLTSDVFGGQSRPLPFVGTYQLNTDSLRWDFGVGLLNPEESRLTIASGSEVSGLTGNASLAHWFLIAAILLLVVESLLYHRRVVG